MVSSLISVKSSSGNISGRNEGEKKEKSKQENPTDSSITICMTIFIFRGVPDTYYNRHVLLYFTSPDKPEFHETVHTQRQDNGLWIVDQVHNEVHWAMEVNYMSHVNAGMVRVPSGQEMMPVNIAAGVRVTGRETNSDWNCQHFLLEGLQGMVQSGLQEQEWYTYVEGDLITNLMDEALG